MLALFQALFDRCMDGENLVCEDFLFGVEIDRMKIPLTWEFLDMLNLEVCKMIFGPKNDRLVKSHSLRKGGATSFHESGACDFDVRPIGRWSVGNLDFYVAASPHYFVALNKTLAVWSLMAFEQRLNIQAFDQ